MRKQWFAPKAEGEKFVANEYVAACYKIKCNVPSGVGYYEKNGKPGYQNGSWRKPEDEKIASGKGCGIYHIGVNLDEPPTENAMWDPNNGEAYPVFHWVDGYGNNGHHFSKVSDAEWETNPNAS